MSEAPTPRGAPPPDPLETLLRAAGAELEYPPTPPLASAVRARLEREAAAPRRGWLPWRRETALTPTLSQGEREKDARALRWGGEGTLSTGQGKGGERASLPLPQTKGGERASPPLPLGEGGGEGRRHWSPVRWAVPSLAAAAVALALVVWVPRAVAPMFSTAGASLAGGGGASSDALQRPAAPALGGQRQAPAVPQPLGRAAPEAARDAAPAASARAAPSPAAAFANQPQPVAPAAQAGQAGAAEAVARGVSDAAAPSSPPDEGNVAPVRCAPGSTWGTGLSRFEPVASLAVAETRAGFGALAPSALGEPTEVCAMPAGVPGQIELRYAARPDSPPLPDGKWLAVLLQQRHDSIATLAPSGVEQVRWEGNAGFWRADGSSIGNVLWWTQSGFWLRLDTPLSRDEAIAIAASVAPVSR